VLVMVLFMVPSSVEEKRISTMKNLRNIQRNSLKREHLTAC